MNKLTTTLKITAITLNTLFLAVLVLLCIKNPPEGPSSIGMATIVFFFPIINLPLLLLSSKLLSGPKGAVFITFSTLIAIFILLIFVFAIAQSGFPEPAAIGLFAILLIITPLLTIPAVFMLRASVKKNTPNTNTITCPHCAGEISI